MTFTVKHKAKNHLLLSIKAVLLCVFMFTTGCMQEELCEDVTANPLRVGFYRSDNGDKVPVSLDSLSVIGLGHDSFLYEKIYNVGMIELPLNVLTDSCGFVLSFHENTDSLKVYYERNLSLVSLECGFVTFFIIKDIKVTNNAIQTFVIESYNVTNINEQHLQIFIYSDPD